MVEAGFCLFLCDGAIYASVFEAAAYFVQDVEVVLDVLDGALSGSILSSCSTSCLAVLIPIS